MADAIRYYFDQHMPRPIADGLLRRGIDVLTAQDADRCGLADIEQLEFAAAQSRVMVSFDPDFLAIHGTGISHAEIAWCPAAKYGIGEMIQMLVLVHAVISPEEMRNHVEYF